MTTYNLAQYAAIVFALKADEVPTPAQLQWLSLRLRRGELPGYKAGRRWYATQDDVNAAIERLRPRRIVPSVPVMSGLTRTSARRLSA